MAEIDLSIIVPSRQEAKRLEPNLKALSAYLNEHDMGTVEVVIPVGRSRDHTLEIAKNSADLFKHYKVISLGNIGKGYSVHQAMLHTEGRYRMFMDADLATPLHHLEEIKRLMDERIDVAIGVRDLAVSHKGLRKLISGFGNLLVQWVLLPGVKDSQCGFKLFSADAAEATFERQTIWGWGFDMEILAIARQLGYKTKFIQVDDWHDVAGGTFNNVAVKAALQTFLDLARIKYGILTGKYRHVGTNQKKA